MEDPPAQDDAQPAPGEETLADLIFNAEITDKPAEEDAQDTEQKATIEELASVLLNPEEIPRDSKREFAKNLYKSFRSCQRFMNILGRFPIASSENDDHSIVFEYNWNSIRGTVFFITFTILSLITLFSTLNIISTMLNFPKHPEDGLIVHWHLRAIRIAKDKATSSGSEVPALVQWKPILAKVPLLSEVADYPKWAVISNYSAKLNKTQKLLRAEEMFIFRRNLAPLLMVLFLLYHIIFSDLNLYKRRHFVANYLTFWTESVEIMKIDAAGDAKKFTKMFLICYLIWLFIFCITLASNIAPVASGAPVSFAFLWVRLAYPQIHAVGDVVILTLRILGGIVYLYAILCSKVYVLFFLYICKILKTACTVWNERLEKVFTQEERKRSRKEKCAARTGFDHLFKDYVTLLDLLSGADTLFANIIESYFSMTLISIVFEVYYLIRPISEAQMEFTFARTFDMILVGLYLFNSLMVFYLVSTGAAEVGEAAANGLEIIRRQGIMGHRSDSEMHFMISLYMSYTGHFDTALTGGGYFILDKAFFVAIAGTMLSYIIIIFQFQPTLGIQPNSEQEKIIKNYNGTTESDVNLVNLIMHVENTFYYRENREPRT